MFDNAVINALVAAAISFTLLVLFHFWLLNLVAIRYNKKTERLIHNVFEVGQTVFYTTAALYTAIMVLFQTGPAYYIVCTVLALTTSVVVTVLEKDSE